MMLKLALIFLLAYVNVYAGEYELYNSNLLFFGAFAMIIVYNLGYLFVLKSAMYASYFMFHIGVFIIMLFYTGMIDEPWFELNVYGIPVGIFFLSMAMLLAFSRDFLDLKSVYTTMEDYINKLIIINLLLVAVSAFSSTNTLLETISVSLVIIQALGLVLLSAYLSFVKQNTHARFYFFSFSFLLITLGLVFLNYFELTTIDHSVLHLLELGVLIEAGGLSFAMTYKQKESEIKLQQNELLFRELSHRVQNNLQQIISILTMQTSNTQDMTVKAHLENTINRIGSIALIHKTLQSSLNYGNVNMYTYLKALIEGYQDLNKEVSFHFDCNKEIELSLDKLTPLALILNELITNSIKHAFKNSDNAQVDIKLEGKERMLFTYEDNGAGFNKESTTSSIGTQLVNLLSKSQLKGKVNVDSNRRYYYSLEFFK